MPYTLLIDGDILTHRVGYSLQTTYYICSWTIVQDDGAEVGYQAYFENAERRDEGLRLLGLPKEVVHIEPRVQDLAGTRGIACGRMKQYLENIVSGCNAQLEEFGESVGESRIFLSGPSEANFRNAVATVAPYKHNRTQEKPLWYPELRTYLIEHCNAEVSTNWEADDSIGIAWGGSTIIVSIDKDLLQFPGLHYNPVTGVLFRVSTDEARANFFRQVLTGDAGDGIPGCYKVGPAQAEKLIPVGLSSSECWKRVVDKYTTNMAQYPDKHGDHWDPEWRATETARLVKILHNEHELWNDNSRPPEDLQEFIMNNIEEVL